MIWYLDTSVLVSALTREAATGRVLDWLDGLPEGAAMISDWVVTEFSSALALKLRAGGIGLADRAVALSLFSRMVAESLACVPVAPEQFRTAARFVDQHGLGLRAGGALHLAVCAAHGARLCTLDRRLAEAGPAVGVDCLVP